MCMPVKRLYYQLLATNVDQVDLSEIITNRDDRRLIIDSYSQKEDIILVLSKESLWMILGLSYYFSIKSWMMRFLPLM